MSWPSAGHYIEALINSATGNPIISGGYQILQSDGTTLVVIYTDAARTSTRSQPLTTTADGNAEFYAEPGDGYILKVGSNTDSIDVKPQVADLALLLTAAQRGAANDFGGGTIYGYRNVEKIYTGTTYNFDRTVDNQATVQLNNASAIAAPLPLTAQPGDGFSWVQEGAGQITFSVAGPGQLDNAHSHTKSFGQYARGYCECIANAGGAAEWALSGDTSA